ncbi:hypothetical protein B0T22DRAFT_370054 [Podospora appendiculata]|uniref:Rhodopsin domain-containing protein n=1 Tax=Podospora appendiculata TaxID=314037 RepID=A0AAE0XHL3_9PEZI|nr:hypothetical protein B0T22DRAFT_370054 [Podospora appendiculata]
MADSAPVVHSPEYMAANKGPDALATICTVMALSTAFVSARVFVRGYLMRKLQADDYIIIAAWVCAWVCVSLSVEAVRSGVGRHMDTLDVDQMQSALKFTIFGFVPGVMSFALPKFAVVSLLTRLLNPSRKHRIFLWAMAGLCQILLLGCIIILFAQCSPSRAQWDFSITDAVCWDHWILVKYSIGAGSFSAAADLYLAIYPTIVLFKLHVETKKKIALCVALGIGSVATVVAIYKTTRLPSLASADFTWDTADLTIWTIVEGSTIIIASCIPILQPLVDFARGRRTRGSNSSGYRNYGSSADGKLASGHELETSRATGGGRRLKPRNPDDDLLNTVVDKASYLGTTKAGSQDSILPTTSGGSSGSDHEVDLKEAIGLPKPKPTAGNIVRTQEVKVEYGVHEGTGAGTGTGTGTGTSGQWGQPSNGAKWGGFE